ncbi:MAG: sn-glycerol-3-phosphate ABC transporter ATP-binding protein UgpC [Chloroflexi bacterium]|nr:sn-glycerol-3-phosphate ABC transporter ATP-binding protein UgpC [Chloroflexota bacterium]
MELVGVNKRYGALTVLEHVDLEIEPGEFVVLLGPSGCGKSTILKIIAGLEDASGGEVYIQDRLVNYVRPKDRDVSMVFQNYALYPHMTVAANIGFPLKMRKVARDVVAQRVTEVAALLELGQQLTKYPEQLSGGQRQRVALGRAIIRDPVAFLMDEPLSNLDAILRVQMRSELLQLHRRVGKTTIYVTHDQVEAMTMADRIVVLKDGAVQQIGTTREIYSRPANTFVATFVGSPQMNLLPGHIERRDGSVAFVGVVRIGLDAAPPVEDGTQVTLGIRPEDIRLRSAETPGADAVATVRLVEDVGAEDFVTVDIDGTRCVVRVAGHGSVSEGTTVALEIPRDVLHVFGADGTRMDPAP